MKYLKLKGGYLYHAVESDRIHSRSVAICGVAPGKTRGNRVTRWLYEGSQATCKQCKNILQARESNQQEVAGSEVE
jgi:hypothetical protein